jgi:hypothetical protein
LNGLDGVISQKIVIFITIAVRTSDPTQLHFDLVLLGFITVPYHLILEIPKPHSAYLLTEPSVLRLSIHSVTAEQQECKECRMSLSHYPHTNSPIIGTKKKKLDLKQVSEFGPLKANIFLSHTV